jgi:hypothetical protein
MPFHVGTYVKSYADRRTMPTELEISSVGAAFGLGWSA